VGEGLGGRAAVDAASGGSCKACFVCAAGTGTLAACASVIFEGGCSEGGPKPCVHA
jgi:hypothetical protein